MRRSDLDRPPAHERGYGATWRKVRAEVLRAAGIPEERWKDYVVDHSPPWPSLGADHSKYRLTPMLRSMHSRRTVAAHGGFGRSARVAAWRGVGTHGELFSFDTYEQQRADDVLREWANS